MQRVPPKRQVADRKYARRIQFQFVQGLVQRAGIGGKGCSIALLRPSRWGIYILLRHSSAIAGLQQPNQQQCGEKTQRKSQKIPHLPTVQLRALRSKAPAFHNLARANMRYAFGTFYRSLASA